MTLAVVAGNALEIDAQEIFAGADGHLVIRIRLIDQDVVEVVYMIAEQKVGGPVDKVIARLSRQQIMHQLVIRHVQQQRTVDIVSQQVPPADSQLGGGIAEQVAEKVRPFVEKRRFGLVDLAFDGRGQQRINHLLALRGILIREEFANHFRLGQAASEVEVDTAQELGVRAQARVRDMVALHLGKNELVDQVPDGNRLDAGV